ncbi:uncharacterized protein LOC117121607, partial [Anneissia japonica]|uniref:uncharacterized protein LOC117121607 n=1 Tax=Anneissia japonica TaxID=1529436 RepID=UPI001425B457
MVRNFKRKSERGKDTDLIRRAVRSVLHDQLPVRAVAKEFGVSYSTLQRHVNKIKADADNQLGNRMDIVRNVSTAKIGYQKNRQVFTDEQEHQLVQYIIRASSMYFGMTPDDIRSFACEIATAHDIAVPE